MIALFVLSGATPAALGLLADVSEGFEEDRSAIMGLYSVFLGVGQVIGAAIGGVAASWKGIDGLLVATGGLLGGRPGGLAEPSGARGRNPCGDGPRWRAAVDCETRIRDTLSVAPGRPPQPAPPAVEDEP